MGGKGTTTPPKAKVALFVWSFVACALIPSPLSPFLAGKEACHTRKVCRDNRRPKNEGCLDPILSLGPHFFGVCACRALLFFVACLPCSLLFEGLPAVLASIWGLACRARFVLGACLLVVVCCGGMPAVLGRFGSVPAVLASIWGRACCSRFFLVACRARFVLGACLLSSLIFGGVPCSVFFGGVPARFVLVACCSPFFLGTQCLPYSLHFGGVPCSLLFGCVPAVVASFWGRACSGRFVLGACLVVVVFCGGMPAVLGRFGACLPCSPQFGGVPAVLASFWWHAVLALLGTSLPCSLFCASVPSVLRIFGCVPAVLASCWGSGSRGPTYWRFLTAPPFPPLL